MVADASTIWRTDLAGAVFDQVWQCLQNLVAYQPRTGFEMSECNNGPTPHLPLWVMGTPPTTYIWFAHNQVRITPAVRLALNSRILFQINIWGPSSAKPQCTSAYQYPPRK